MILADIGNPFYSELAENATRIAREMDLELVVSHSADSPTAVKQAVVRMARLGVEGVILTTLNSDDHEVLGGPLLRSLPIVSLSRRVPERPEIPFDGIDDFLAGMELMSHVLSHGFKEIAIATGGFRSYATSQRIQGFKKVAEEAGISIPRESIMSTELNDLGGDLAAEYLLGRGKLPEVVVCGADAIAAGLINRLAVAGVVVPKDICVVGFDGTRGIKNPFFDLTTIVQPTSEMARGAIEKILSLAREGSVEETISIHKHRLHIGSTCGIHKEGDSR